MYNHSIQSTFSYIANSYLLFHSRISMGPRICNSLVVHYKTNKMTKLNHVYFFFYVKLKMIFGTVGQFYSLLIVYLPCSLFPFFSITSHDKFIMKFMQFSQSLGTQIWKHGTPINIGSQIRDLLIVVLISLVSLIVTVKTKRLFFSYVDLSSWDLVSRSLNQAEDPSRQFCGFKGRRMVLQQSRDPLTPFLSSSEDKQELDGVPRTYLRTQQSQAKIYQLVTYNDISYTIGDIFIMYRNIVLHILFILDIYLTTSRLYFSFRCIGKY